MESSYIGLTSAVVAIVAAVVTVAVGIDQLTLPARLRRIESWARDASQHETAPNRRWIAEALRRRATARIVASEFIPTRNYVVGLSFAGLAAWVSASVAAAGQPWTDVVLSTLTCLATATLYGSRTVRAYTERQRIAREYFTGEIVKPPVLLALPGRSAYLWALSIVTPVCIGAIGVGMAIESKSLDWIPLVMVIGALFVLDVPTSILRKRGLTWTFVTAHASDAVQPATEDDRDQADDQ